MPSVRPPTQLTIYLILFVLSFLLALFLTPLTIRLAKRVGAMDYPTARKIHSSPIPRLGGIGLAGAVLLTLVLGYIFSPYIREGSQTALNILPGLLIVLVVGIYDDIYGAPALFKLAAQISAAGVTAMLGIQFQLTSNPLGAQMRDYFDLGMLSIPMTMVWMIGLTNAFNLIDGLDGLATGIALFASIALFLISLQQSAGVVTFFYAALACLSTLGTQKSYTVAALFIPLIVFGVPIFDAIITLIRRYIGRNGMMLADNGHIHHRLVSAGMTQRQAVIILYAISIVLGIIAFTFTLMLDEYAAVVLGIIGILGGFTAKELNVFGTSRRRTDRETQFPEPVRETELVER